MKVGKKWLSPLLHHHTVQRGIIRVRQKGGMKWFLYFTYSPDYGEKWHKVDGKLVQKRMWSTCFIDADSEKMARDIAHKHMGEFTLSHLVELRPEI